jgi:WD40 repeat protein
VTSSSDGSLRVWDARSGQLLSTISGTNPAAPRRYQKDNPDNMPTVGPDNFQILQDQIDALQKRVETLERKLNAKP